MTSLDILYLRLYNQQIAVHHFNTPGEVVKWLGAVQAQDYLGALWAVGSRLNKVKESEVEQSLANKTIVRTWPMRGTLHFVAPEDAKWMLQLLTPRVISRAASVHRNAGLDKKVFDKSRKVLIKALQGKAMVRSEVYQVLEDAKIATSETRGLHILGVLAQEGLVCFGPRMGKQQSFVLFDEWITNSKMLNGDEALAELTQRYFTSHGPATVHDFVWWSGLTVAKAKRGLELVKTKFVSETVGDQTYWMNNNIILKTKAPDVYLLSSFDEYLVGYKDRSAALANLHSRKVFSINGIFSPVVIINGKIVATWKKSFNKNEVLVQLQSFQTFTPSQKTKIEKAARLYSKFADKSLKLQF